jgi:hypothetical protein
MNQIFLQDFHTMKKASMHPKPLLFIFYPKSAEDYGREPVGESVPCAGV